MDLLPYTTLSHNSCNYIIILDGKRGGLPLLSGEHCFGSKYPQKSKFLNWDKTSNPAEAPSDGNPTARSPARLRLFNEKPAPASESSSGEPVQRAKSEVLCWYPLGISINQHISRSPVVRARPQCKLKAAATASLTLHRSCAEWNLDPRQISI